MQPFLLIPEADWNRVLGRLTKLEEAEIARLQAATAPPDEVLTSTQAAVYLGLSVDAVLRARRAGRLKGIRLNEQSWGFHRSALDKYPRRGHRATLPQAA